MPALPAVCFFAQSLDLGGLQLVILRLATGFAAAGHPVTLVLQQGGGELLAQLPAPVEVVVLGTPTTLGTLVPLTRFLRRRRPDALISGLPHANLLSIAAARLSRRPIRVIVSEHAPLGDLIRAHAGWRYRILPMLIRLLYPRADAVVAVSAGLADELKAILPPGRPVHLVHNPVVPPDLERRLAEPLAPDETPDLPLIVGLGRLSPEKNFALLIRAFALLVRARPARLVLLGEGPERPALERLIAALGLGASVRLAGFTANPYPMLKRARLLALASDFEGFGNVLVEAMACGTAVVSTDCPYGPREILADGRYGRLVPMGDAAALAAAMGATLDQPPDPACLTARAQDFTLARSVAGYRRLIADRAGSERD